MLFRRNGEGAWALSQLAHSWLTGELGRAWRRGPFALPGLDDELLCGAAIHDFGYAEWEKHPTLDPSTGLPYDFRSLPHDDHLRLWHCGIGNALQVSPRAALYVSLHSCRLYSLYYKREDHTQAEDDSLQAYLQEQRRLQDRLLAMPGASALDRPTAENLTVLLGAWDRLSHYLLETDEDFSIEAIPGPDGPLTLRGRFEEGGTCRLDPWPFDAPIFTRSHLARWLPGPVDSQAELDRVFPQARQDVLHARALPL